MNGLSDGGGWPRFGDGDGEARERLDGRGQEPRLAGGGWSALLTHHAGEAVGLVGRLGQATRTGGITDGEQLRYPTVEIVSQCRLSLAHGCEHDGIDGRGLFDVG